MNKNLLLLLAGLLAGSPALASSFIPGTDPVVQTNTGNTATGVGAPTDPAYTGSGSASVVASIKGAYNLLAGTLTVGTHAVTQSGSWVLSAGAAIIGKVGIDQTIPGTTNGVVVNAALPAGTNALGSILTSPNSVTYAAPTSSSVSASATVVAAPGTKITKVCNTTSAGGGNIWLNPNGGTAVAGAGDLARSGGGCVTYNGAVTNSNGNVITGVSDSGTATFAVTKGS